MNCLWFAWVNEYEIENPTTAINCILNKTKPIIKLQGSWPKL